MLFLVKLVSILCVILRWCCRVAIWPPCTFPCTRFRSPQFLSATFFEYSIESWSGKNSEELPACIEKAYVVVTYTLHKFVLLVIFTWSGVRSCSKIILQRRLKHRHFPPSAWETGKESSLGRRVKTMVTVDWRPPKGRFEPKKKPLEGAC